ncbi:MAG TPA: hypothetical protein VE985_05490 [Gaiellaceae bacterium]|nr:hypothetical protein [Gaiellaceae bacterium]
MSGTAELDEVAALLESADTAWVRLAVTKAASAWDVRTLEVTLSEPPPSWEQVNWRYADVRLVASAETGATVASWLREREITSHDLSAPLGDLASNALTERRQSGWSRTGHEPLEWPADEWCVAINRPNTFSGELISEGAGPSFVSFDLANANLLGLTSTPSWSPSTPELVVRRQDTSGRLSRVFVDFTEVVVTVDGYALGPESTVELAGQIPGKSLPLERNRVQRDAQTVRFSTPTGLPSGAWVLLRRDGKWIDRRTLWNERSLAQETGVEFAAEAADSDDDYFSQQEQARLREAIATAKAFVLVEKTDALSGNQLRALQASLDSISESVSSLRRHQWIDQTRGAVVTLVLEQLVPHGIVIEVFRIIAHAIPQLLPHTLPALLP